MANKIILKKSSETSKVPVDLDYGELALNYKDGKLYYKTSANEITAFTANAVTVDTAQTVTGTKTVKSSLVYQSPDANSTISSNMLDGGTLAFEGSSGQLFSISDSMSGTVFSVNDISGIPSVEVLDTGLIKLAEFGGDVLIGTATDNGIDLLQVGGSSAFGTNSANYLQVAGAATGTYPSLSAAGSNTNVGITFKVKGAPTGPGIRFESDSANVLAAILTSTPSTVNYLRLDPSITETPVALSAQGSDTNVSLQLLSKGVGEVNLSTSNGIGFQVYDKGGENVNFWSARGSNTSASPYLYAQGTDTNVSGYISSKGNGDLIFQTNGGNNTQLAVTHTASSVNYVNITGSATGNQPVISAKGSDTNITMSVAAKGSGVVIFSSNSAEQFRTGSTASAVNSLQLIGSVTGQGPTIQARGSDANVDLRLTPKGDGSVIVNGNISATTFVGPLTGNADTATNVAYSGLTGTVPTWNQSTTGTSSGVVRTVTGTTTAELVRGNMSDNDQFRILVGGSASNAGYVELATADDGTEPIYVRQYTGVFTNIARTAALLDGSGNTSFPGTVTAPIFSGALTGSASTATALAAGRTIALTGDVIYTSGAFDGSANVTGTATLASVGTAGTYTKVTTDAKGRVTSGTSLAAADIPVLDASKITTGVLDAARLPSYVDDVLEYANLAAFPAAGETGKIYVAIDTNKTYRWSGSVYVFITSGAVDSVAGKTGVVTLVKGDVGLSNVDNTADSTKSVASAGVASTVTNGVYTIGNQTIAGLKTFSDGIVSTSAIIGNITGTKLRAVESGSQIYIQAGDGTAGSSANINFANYGTTSSALTIDLANNKVGIGTQSPIDKLQVVDGNITIDNSNYYKGKDSTGVSRNLIGINSSNNTTIGTNVVSGRLIVEGGSTVTTLMTLASDNKVGIGTTNPEYTLEVNGSFAATSKSFLIQHPTKPGKKLRHGSLEGPEHGVYVRGKIKGGVIELPEYWTKLVDPDSITVQLTAIGKGQKLYVEDIRDNKVYIANEGMFTSEPHCFYYVQAERVDVEKMEVELDGN